MQTSAFHAEAGFRERIAERRLLTLSRPSGEVFYRHEVYRKPVVSVQPSLMAGVHSHRAEIALLNGVEMARIGGPPLTMFLNSIILLIVWVRW